MKKHSIISILFLGAILAQKLPYGKPNYFQIVQNKKDLKQITLKTPFDFPQELFDDVQRLDCVWSDKFKSELL